MKPLAIDLFCGLGGWTEGLLAEGFNVVGFDIERRPYPAQLVLQDVLTLHGSQFKDAALIVASPPCQFFSYCAMPWSLAKALAARVRASSELTAKEKALFYACFRIQIEASHAAGRYIPLIVENVRGAQPWVGPSAWNYGSFYLWGDIPALMPMTTARKNSGGSWFNIAHNTTSGVGQNPVTGVKVPGMNFHDHEKNGKPGRSFQSAAVDTFGWSKDSTVRRNSSHSSARKAASAAIAKIPFPLARHIARAYKPLEAL